MEIEVINNSANSLPKTATKYSAGKDVCASLATTKTKFFVDAHFNFDENGNIKNLEILPGGRCLVDSGLVVGIPEGYDLDVYCRSGLALKKGITVLNGVGVVDADYRKDPIGVIIMNLGKESFIIEEGDRICQLILRKFENFEWKEVEQITELDSTRESGFGSTGVKKD